MKDILIGVDCDYTYHIRTRDSQTDYNYIEYERPWKGDENHSDFDYVDKATNKTMNFLTKALEVDATTCEFKYDLEKWTQVRHFPANDPIIDDKCDGTWSKDSNP